MRKLIIIFVILASACYAEMLFADDFKYEYVSALSKNDYTAAEKIITKNINAMSAQEKRQMLNLTLTYSRGDNALPILEIFKKHNVLPGSFDLFTAINKNQSDAVIRFILNSGAQANGEILLLAMEKQRFEFAKQFIQSGIDVNYQYPLGKDYADGMTCLLYASKNKNFDLVKMLVDRGASIDARNKDGETALSIAQSNGNSQISDFLIESGANQNLSNIRPPQSQNHAQTQTQTASGGIGSFLDNQLKEFQPGKYKLSKGNRDLQFTGTANFGNVGFIRNNKTYSGTYQINGASMIVILEGQMFTYVLDSSVSFSGNGETWVRVP